MVNVTSPVTVDDNFRFDSMTDVVVAPESPVHGEAVTVAFTAKFTSFFPVVQCAAVAHNFLFQQSWEAVATQGLNTPPVDGVVDVRFEVSIPSAVRGIHVMNGVRCLDAAGRTETTHPGPTLFTVDSPGELSLLDFSSGAADAQTVDAITHTDVVTLTFATSMRFNEAPSSSSSGLQFDGCDATVVGVRSSEHQVGPQDLTQTLVSYDVVRDAQGILHANFTLVLAGVPPSLEPGAVEAWRLDSLECCQATRLLQRHTIASRTQKHASRMVASA